MLKGKKSKGLIKVACAGFAVCMILQPMDAMAAGNTTVRDIMSAAGIASYIEVQMTAEEY